MKEENKIIHRGKAQKGALGLSGLLVLLLLSGCFSLLPDPAPASTIYRLSVPVALSPPQSKNTKVINIEYPNAARALRGSDIIVSPDGRRLSAASGASWAEPVPEQLRHVLIDTLAKDGQLVGVIPKGSTRVPYRLNMDIRRFEAVFDQGEAAAPLAVVQLQFNLTDTQTRKLVGTYSVQTKKRAKMRAVSAIVEAQDLATGEAMAQVVDWLKTQVR